MTERTVQSDGARLWSISNGEGDLPVLLLNGGPGCDDYLAPVADMLAERARVIRYEPRGAGRSDWDGRYDLATAVADVEQVRQSYSMDRVLLTGHSFGANLGLAYCLEYPQRVLGLIGLAGGKVVDDRSWSEIYHRNRDSKGEALGGLSFTADPQLNETLNESWKSFCRRPKFLKNLTDLQMPIHFINAGTDNRPNWPTEQLANLLPHASYEVIPNAGHFLWLTHSLELKQSLLAILDRFQEQIEFTVP